MDFRSGHRLLALIVLTASSATQSIAAPFQVDLTNNAIALAQSILGPGISIVGTPTLSAQAGQAGLFTDFDSEFYTIPSGALLTTGIASGAMGSYIGGPNFEASGPGDPQLSDLTGAATFDAAVLTIQFTSANPSLFLNSLLLRLSTRLL